MKVYFVIIINVETIKRNLPRGLLYVRVYFFVKAFNMRVYFVDVDEISFFLCLFTLLVHISLNDAMLMHVVKT